LSPFDFKQKLKAPQSVNDRDAFTIPALTGLFSSPHIAIHPSNWFDLLKVPKVLDGFSEAEYQQRVRRGTCTEQEAIVSTFKRAELFKHLPRIAIKKGERAVRYGQGDIHLLAQVDIKGLLCSRSDGALVTEQLEGAPRKLCRRDCHDFIEEALRVEYEASIRRLCSISCKQEVNAIKDLRVCCRLIQVVDERLEEITA
jgi:hypothetical protein